MTVPRRRLPIPSQSAEAEAERRAQPASEWRREFFGEQRRRGNAFRDALYDAMGARGLTAEQGWQREKKSPIETEMLPARFLDIYNVRLQTGAETKLGGGEHQHLMNQIRNDLRAIAAGDDRIWVHNDLSRLRDKGALEALRAMEQQYPTKFALVDASDPKSIAAFRERMPHYKGIADAIPEARQVFQHYDAQYAARTAAGDDFSIKQARREWQQTDAPADRVRTTEQTEDVPDRSFYERFPELRVTEPSAAQGSFYERFPELGDGGGSGGSGLERGLPELER